ncbi:hypothetical protein [Psychroflexus salarius]|nr:hypothetical protein [Psychroflexus salarius]
MKLFQNALIMIFLFAFFGCEDQSNFLKPNVYTYNFEPVVLIKKGQQSNFTKNTNNDSLVLSSVLTSNIKIPQDILNSTNESQIENFFLNHKNIFNGELTFYFNDIADKSFEINLNGENQNDAIHLKNTEYPGRDECSYEGIRQCVRYNIYEGMNTMGKLICAAAGMNCIAEEAAQCASKNCLDDTPPNQAE